jgi:hypothetical protein
MVMSMGGSSGVLGVLFFCQASLMALALIGQHGLKAAWLVSSLPASMQFAHLYVVWAHDVPMRLGYWEYECLSVG